MKQRVLILCTGNSARSQMAEGLLRHAAGDSFEVASAGTQPSSVRPEAIAVMRELGIDITSHRSKHLQEFDGQRFAYVITVCDHPKESCPVFPGATQRLHRNFEDPPAPGVGTDEERLAVFRRVRDQLQVYLAKFAETHAIAIRPAQAADIDSVSALLEEAKLVALDASSQFAAQYAVALNGNKQIIGVAGLEVFGADALLRSVAVKADRRSHGIGKALTDGRLAWAHNNGVRTLYLLTTTAPGYWQKFGFIQIPRDSAPAAILATSEWHAACPASAIAMRLAL